MKVMPPCTNYTKIFQPIKTTEVLEELINLSDDLKSRYNIFRSAGFLPRSTLAGKGAVHHLADKSWPTRDEVMCLGDHENDRITIEYAGLGVSDGNSDWFD